jgi:hypothetical protein
MSAWVNSETLCQKTTRTRTARGIPQAIESLPRKQKVLSSNPIPPKQKESHVF